MNRLLVLLFLLGAMLAVPTVALAQDEDVDTAVVVDLDESEAGQPELPNDTENPGDAVSEANELDTMTSLEYWHMLAILLPVLIGHAGNHIRYFAGKPDKMAQLSVAVYFIYAVFGEALKGSFNELTWDTPQLVAASLVKVAGISYAAYKIVGNATPRVVGGIPGPTA